MNWRLLSQAFALPLLLAVPPGCGTGSDIDPHQDDSTTDAIPDLWTSVFENGQLAQGIVLLDLEVNQGVAIAVAQDRQPLDILARDNSLVRNRHALIRANYRLEGFAGGTVQGRLYLRHVDGQEEVLTSNLDVVADADLTTLGKTFEWRLTPEQVQAGMQIAVGLFVPDTTGVAQPSSPARIPASGTFDLGVPDRPMEMHVVVVNTDDKLSYNETNLQNLADIIYEHNPVEYGQVHVSLRAEPIDGGTSLQTCLSAVKRARSADAPAHEVYYLGMISGGLGGLSDLADDTIFSATRRTSCSFNGPTKGWPRDKNQVAVHEIGHAEGSEHTPGCEAGWPVSDYPDLDTDGIARLGVWGYSVLRDELYEPNLYGDIMCYCRPHWTSRYTYNNWSERIATLSSWAIQESRSVDMQRETLLWGIVGQTEATWWIADDVLPPSMPREGMARLTVEKGGARVQSHIETYRDLLSDGRTYLVALPMVGDSLAQRSLKIEVAGHEFTLDALENMMDAPRVMEY